MLLFPGAGVCEKWGYDVLEGCLQLVERLQTVRADSLLIARSVSISYYCGIYWLLTDDTVWKKYFFPISRNSGLERKIIFRVFLQRAVCCPNAYEIRIISV